jgi:molybdopterin synthase sulfur carrier subunit
MGRLDVMKITLRYFAQLRESLGLDAEVIETSAIDLAALRQQLQDRGAPYAQALAADQALRCALNQQLCQWDTALVDQAEVAFFPPVTGG